MTSFHLAIVAFGPILDLCTISSSEFRLESFVGDGTVLRLYHQVAGHFIIH